MSSTPNLGLQVFASQDPKHIQNMEMIDACIQALLTPGTATLSAGTIAVSLSTLAAGSTVLFARKTPGGTTGALSVVLTPGTGFTFNSASSSDTSVIAYTVVPPVPVITINPSTDTQNISNSPVSY